MALLRDVVHGPMHGALYTGIAVSPAGELPFHSQVAIGSHNYIIDPAKYRRTTLALMRQPTDQSVEPGEQSLSPQGLWRRSQDNWFLGAGQEYLDNRFAFVSVYTVSGESPSVRTRFYRSKGVNVWTEGSLSLLPETERKIASTAANLQVLEVNGDLYRVDGTEVYFTTDPTPATPTWTAAGIQAGAGTAHGPYSVTTDGYNLYAALGANGISKTASRGATSSTLTAGATYAATLVGYANGHLLASTGHDLVEIDSAGAVHALWTHPNPTFVWDGIAPGPSGIYVWGHAGTHSQIMVITLSSAGALNVPAEASHVPLGELVNVVAYYDSAMVLGTSVGLRQGTAPNSTDGVFDTGPVITGLGAVNALAPFQRFVWCSCSNYSTVDEITTTAVTSTGLGRVDISNDTSALTPAWATDVMATDGVTGIVGSIAVVGGRRYFSVAGDGVWGENANVVASGTLETGWIRYGMTEPKVLVYTSVRHAPLAGSITVTPYNESGTALQSATNAAAGSTGPSPSQWSVGLAVGEQFMLAVTLNRSGTDSTAGPTLRRWTAKAMAVAPRQDEILVPIILRSRVESLEGEGEPIYFDTLAEFQFLKALEASGAIVTYTEGTTSYSCIVDQVEVSPEKWTDTREFFEGMVTVRLVTLA